MEFLFFLLLVILFFFRILHQYPQRVRTGCYLHTG